MKTEIGLQIPQVAKIFSFSDHRGSLNELGEWAQKTTNVKWSTSKKGVVRGFHWQASPFQQEKHITVLNGAIFDVCLDLSNRKLYQFNLRYGGTEKLIVPEGYAHAFQALEENTVVVYGSLGPYSRAHERSLNPMILKDFGGTWPLPCIISEKDRNAPLSYTSKE